MSVTGFSNARSSEYMVLNDLYNRIKSNCNLFYPFFYNKLRDDTNLSILNDVKKLKVIACFARRPKTDSVLSPITIITFRESIFEQVNYLKDFEIPVLAASPIGTGIENIGFGSECKWFSISPGVSKNFVEYVFLDGHVEKDCLVDGINLIENNDIINLLKSGPDQSWIDIIQKVKEWYSVYSNYYFSYHNRNLFNSVSGLKPVFIVCRLNNNL